MTTLNNAEQCCHFLTHTSLTPVSILKDSSNQALVCTTEDAALWAIYKPHVHERFLHDFSPHTLAQREVASYLIASAIGLNYIPPTVMREGPLGQGSVQLWIGSVPNIQYPLESARGVPQMEDPLPELPYVSIAPTVPPDFLPIVSLQLSSGRTLWLAHGNQDALADIAFLDLILNNADRKASHILVNPKNHAGYDQQIWAIDHGICLHDQPKLRTILWGFAGREFSEKHQEILTHAHHKLNDIPQLKTLLSAHEYAAIEKRINYLQQFPVFPQLQSISQLPWPWI